MAESEEGHADSDVALDGERHRAVAGAEETHLRHGDGVREEVDVDAVAVVEGEHGQGEAHDRQEEVQGVPEAGKEIEVAVRLPLEFFLFINLNLKFRQTSPVKKKKVLCSICSAKS